MRTELSSSSRLATARTLKVEQIWIDGILRAVFRDSKGLWRDFTTGEVLFTPAAALPPLLFFH